jgi:hypothetical protein
MPICLISAELAYKRIIGDKSAGHLQNSKTEAVPIWKAQRPENSGAAQSIHKRKHLVDAQHASSLWLATERCIRKTYTTASRGDSARVLEMTAWPPPHKQGANYSVP